MTKQLSNLLRTFENEMGIVCDSEECTAKRTKATEIVTVHQIDLCDKPEKNSWVPTPKGAGNQVFQLCYPCGRDLVNYVDGEVKRMRAELKPPAQWLECTSCGKRIESVWVVCTVEALLNV